MATSAKMRRGLDERTMTMQALRIRLRERLRSIAARRQARAWATTNVTRTDTTSCVGSASEFPSPCCTRCPQGIA
eukprot:906496-Rhodomonas_salina.4